MSYVVECLPDETLVRLVSPRTIIRVQHRSGKPEVLKFVRRTQGSVGVIDEDPSSVQPPLLGQLIEIESRTTLGLKRSRFSNGNVVITVSPRLEEWVLTDCRHNGISPEQYGLPRDPEAFHDLVNQRLDNFNRLLLDLMHDSERLETLSNWLA